MKPTRMETEDSVLRDSHFFWNGNTKKRNDQAHHLGHGRWKKKDWLKLGQKNLERYREGMDHWQVDSGSMERLLEWGCGGGCNVVSFAEEFLHITGVDISLDSLRVCKEAMTELRPRHSFKVFPISVDNPFAARDLLADSEPYDFLLCLEVLQHMPSAQYAHDVMQLWRELTREGARALVQFRTHYHSRPIHRSHRLTYPENVSRWLMLNPAVFADMAAHAGWTTVWMEGIRPQLSTGYVYAYLERR